MAKGLMYNETVKRDHDNTVAYVKAVLSELAHAHATGQVPATRSLVPLRELACMVHALNHKWWHDPKTGEPVERNVGEMLALVHSEVSEALEGHRKGLKDDHLPAHDMFVVELVDAMIRLLDLLGAVAVTGNAIDIEVVFWQKVAYNISRVDHSHAARMQPGGKAY